MNMQRCRVVAVALMAALMVALVSVVDAQTECCSSCIGKPVDSPYDYDPISFEQCSVKQPGLVRVCCFKCGTWGEPTYGDAVGFASDGTTPTIKTGKWVSLQWSTATKVTFITLKDGQKKTVTPTLNDTAATVTDGYYMICARSKGSIIFRGWGKDSCREASPEKTVQVVEGDAGATCEAAAPTAPKVTKAPNSAGSSSQGEDPNIKNCNLNRASIKEVDGKQQCVCVNEWSGAPACDQMPTWKWIITIGGGIAALFSILISIHAFIKSRNKKKNEEDDEIPTPAPAKDDVEILRIGADRPSANNKAQHDQQTAYQRGFDNNHGVYKMNDREFSL